MKQGNSQGGFQFANLLAQRRLSDMDGPRRLRETAGLDDPHKVIEMAVLHPPFLPLKFGQPTLSA
jgi:hypothetical protein